MTILTKLLDWLFGCHHPRWGFPVTYRIPHRVTVRVCLTCGKARKYDWQAMRFVRFERGEERRLASGEVSTMRL
jgi:NMD protein affecting ribosome stability and mRNA decay